jgi:hypothetical protein
MGRKIGMKTMVKTVCALSMMLVAGMVSAAEPGPARPNNPNLENASLHYAVNQKHKLTLKYDVYAGGFKALNASLEMDLDKKAYDMALQAETQGFIGSLFPWKGAYATSGHAEKGILIPTVYTERSLWRQSLKVTEMDYAPNGKILKSTTQEDGGKITVNRNIDQNLSHDTQDLLTGTLAMLQSVKNTQRCEGKFPVFDGKRRFNIALTDEGVDYIAPSRYSRYSGDAIRCTLKVEPVAGFKKTDAKRGWMAVQNHTEGYNKLPTIWLARMPDSGQMVPVRMEIASAYGSVVAHLAGGTDQ